jgi:hypothetical protein
MRIRESHRGSGGSTRGMGWYGTREDCTREGEVVRDPQRRSREGQRWRAQSADGLVVPVKRRNGRGGKGPWSRSVNEVARTRRLA